MKSLLPLSEKPVKPPVRPKTDLYADMQDLKDLKDLKDLQDRMTA
jgi:hypothetical protein